MKRELAVFFSALMFYTRIPCPQWVSHDEQYLHRATRYFPLMGWIVGITCWLVFIAAQAVWPIDIAVLLAMAASVGITGAFHEDGFADVCDGFGGGWSREKILLIMKDSRVGAYGVIGLVFILLLKFCALTFLCKSNIYLVGLMLISAHAMSRFAAVCIIFTTSYARESADESKARPVAMSLNTADFFIAMTWAVIPLAALVYFSLWHLLIIVPCLVTTVYLRRYYYKWIGGYTGDCLGAAQQVTEVILYLSLIVIWKLL